MNIEPIAGALAAQAANAPTATTGLSGGPQAGMFESLLASIQDVNAQMVASQKAVEAMALGQTDNLHQVVMQLEKSRLAFEVVLQVRNKVLEAYQEVMRMQV